jgi:hypothetical protein
MAVSMTQSDGATESETGGGGGGGVEKGKTMNKSCCSHTKVLNMYCIQQNLLPIFFLDNTSIIF